jgi:hypothetical protein
MISLDVSKAKDMGKSFRFCRINDRHRTGSLFAFVFQNMSPSVAVIVVSLCSILRDNGGPHVGTPT